MFFLLLFSLMGWFISILVQSSFHTSMNAFLLTHTSVHNATKNGGRVFLDTSSCILSHDYLLKTGRLFAEGTKRICSLFSFLETSSATAGTAECSWRRLENLSLTDEDALFALPLTILLSFAASLMVRQPISDAIPYVLKSWSMMPASRNLLS